MHLMFTPLTYVVVCLLIMILVMDNKRNLPYSCWNTRGLRVNYASHVHTTDFYGCMFTDYDPGNG